MRPLVFGRYHRIVVLSVLLLVVGVVLLTGGVAADHQDGDPASGNITGTIENEVDEQLGDVTVSIAKYDDLETTTESDGTYRLEDVPYEDQTLKISDPDDEYKSVSREISVSTTNSPVTENFIDNQALERTTGTISGTVESTDGEITDVPPGATVEIEHDDAGDQELIDKTDLPSTATAGDDGSFTIDKVPTGSVSLTATQDGFTQNSTTGISVTEGNTTTVDPNLNEILTTVDGYVTNTDGDGIRDADVSISGVDSYVWGTLSNTTNASGYYEIKHVPGNEDGTSRTIRVNAQNFERNQESVRISESDVSQDITLSHSGVSLKGTVTDTEGNPLNGISVDVDGEGSTTTGSEGQYNFSSLPFGTHEVTVGHPDYETKTRTVEVERSQSNDESFSLTRETPVRLSIDSVSPDSWQAGDEVTVKYSFDEEVYDRVDFSVDGIEQDELETEYGTFEGEKTFTVPERQQIKEGQYTVELSTLGTTKTESFGISNVFDSEQGDFSETDYQSPAGDFVEVSLSTGDLNEAYILIGGDEDADGGNFENYLDVLHVSGDATFVINTRLVGSDRPSEDVYIPVDGDVTSYAHSIGADSEPTGEFEDVSFEDDNGNEIAATLAEFRSQQGVSSMGSPLQANLYQLVGGGSGTIIDRSDDTPDFRQPIARSNLVLTQPELGDVNIYTLPPGSADRVDQFDDGGEAIGSGDIGSLLGEATETDRIARGDRILIEVQASGMYGALFDQAASEQTTVSDGDVDNIRLEQINTLLEHHEGVHIGLKTTELGGPNHGGSTLQFENVDSSDLHVLADDTADQWDNPDAIGTDPLIGGFYVVIDTRGNDPFDRQPRDGDKLSFDIAYESPPDSRYEYSDYSFGNPPDPFDPAVSEVDGLEHFPYFGSRDATVSANDSFVFEAPYIDYGETTLDDELIVAAEAGGVISGETNIAPGSQAEMELVASNRPNPKTITIEEIEISEDGTFEVTEDFSDFEPGERVEVEFYSQGRLIDNRLIDKRGVRVVDDLDNPSAFEIESLTEEADVVRGQRLSAIETTIVNTGEIADRQLVEFTLDGETIRNQSVTLDAGEDVSLDLSEEFVVLPAGEYEYTVRTEDDERTGQLTVTEPDSENETRINSLDSEGPTVSDSPEESDEPDSPSESDPEGLFGLFGIRSRDVAVAATVTGAMHLLGQWT